MRRAMTAAAFQLLLLLLLFGTARGIRPKGEVSALRNRELQEAESSKPVRSLGATDEEEKMKKKKMMTRRLIKEEESMESSRLPVAAAAGFFHEDYYGPKKHSPEHH